MVPVCSAWRVEACRRSVGDLLAGVDDGFWPRHLLVASTAEAASRDGLRDRRRGLDTSDGSSAALACSRAIGPIRQPRCWPVLPEPACWILWIGSQVIERTPHERKQRTARIPG
ncbi:hypothetical protein BV898_16740 [Hypsibius exemplaris]|uniref:Uncharacterized protein n=1 Tax=Hypsibius exemplaris TaxID=2072580 RepID=A0A9X6RLX9_HYPEX|nr:hypothetical protein BV898_16740 [Hypsibius exemplaris]